MVEDGPRTERQADQRTAGEPGPQRLEHERAAEEPAEPAPVLAGDVAKAELDQRLLDREVEERLEEPRRRDDERVQAEDRRREDAGCDERGEEAESDRGVRAYRSAGAASEDGAFHLGASVVRRSHGPPLHSPRALPRRS